jgi:hypothetical protein
MFKTFFKADFKTLSGEFDSAYQNTKKTRLASKEVLRVIVKITILPTQFIACDDENLENRCRFE